MATRNGEKATFGARDGLVVAALAFVLGSGSLVFPFGADQGEYAAGARAMLRGAVLYRDVFCLKPPLTHSVHVAALGLLGHSMTSIRVVDLLWQAATAAAIAVATFRATRSALAGWVAGCTYALVIARLDFFHSAETDGFLNLPVALAVALFLRPGDGPDRRRSAAGVGALLGVAVLFKYPIGVLLPLLVVARGLERKPGGMRFAGWLLAGFAVPPAGFALWLAASGAMPDFVLVLREVLPSYATAGAGLGLRFLTFAAGVRGFLDLPWSAFTLAFASAAIGRPAGAHGRGRLALLAWWVAALVHLLVQNKFWIYQWSPLLAASSALVGERLDALVKRLPWPERARRRLAVGVLALAGVAVEREIHSRHVGLAKLLAGRTTLEALWSGHRGGHFSLSGQMAVARWIRAHTAPSDRIFIYGYHPTIYFLADRDAGSAFLFDLMLRGDWGWRGARPRLLADLERTKPELVLVVDARRRDAPAAELAGSPALEDFPKLRSWIEESYVAEAELEDEGRNVVDRFTIFRRRSGP